jgi:hypothetical protein
MVQRVRIVFYIYPSMDTWKCNNLDHEVKLQLLDETVHSDPEKSSKPISTATFSERESIRDEDVFFQVQRHHPCAGHLQVLPAKRTISQKLRHNCRI